MKILKEVNTKYICYQFDPSEAKDFSEAYDKAETDFTLKYPNYDFPRRDGCLNEETNILVSLIATEK